MERALIYRPQPSRIGSYKLLSVLSVPSVQLLPEWQALLGEDTKKKGRTHRSSSLS